MTNTLLAQETVSSRYFATDRHKSVEGVSSSRINNCSASLRHGLDEVVDDLCWDGHPLLLECMDQLTHVCQGVHSASNVSVPTHPECVQLALN